jgi:hypothetical protein
MPEISNLAEFVMILLYVLGYSMPSKTRTAYQNGSWGKLQGTAESHLELDL